MADPALYFLAEQYGTITAAAAEVAALRATSQLPKGAIHVISDIHGEYQKLRHVINNASGRLRPLVEEMFKDSLPREELQEFLNILYYPAEVIRLKKDSPHTTPEIRRQWIRGTLDRQFHIIRALIRTRRRKDVKHLAPKEQREIFEALLNAPAGGHDPGFIETQLQELAAFDLDYDLVRSTSRFIRNLTVEELVVAGDLGDRGPRLDRVIDYLMQPPCVSLVWGNHDVTWMGACLGQRALIATVLRISSRYLRMFQLEEGYGILTKTLELLANKAYPGDPATHFCSKRSGQRDASLVARTHKAITILQLKLEGQTISRHPEWDMESRNILKHINYQDYTIELDGTVYPLRDQFLPTIDPADPNRLSPDEEECIQRLEESFTQSPRLWEQMSWMANHGQMAVVRDLAVIFHACLPVDPDGAYLPLTIDDAPRRGPEIFDSFTKIIKRAYRAGAEAASTNDKDWFYYLWAGPLSPLFGKDRMTTFESYFLDNPATHRETPSPWFSLIHDHHFCDRIAADMGVPRQGLLVNGHVPVKVDQGESPLKRGGNAITIDGAFSVAYGDRGFTLILGPEGETLAAHHAFPDPLTAVRDGLDIIPVMTPIRLYKETRNVGDTERGRAISAIIGLLLQLIEAYRSGELQQKQSP